MKTSRAKSEILSSKKSRYIKRGGLMDISDLEYRLLNLDKELHLILKEIRKAKSTPKNIVENATGSWGYDVDSKDFVSKLRRSERLDQL
jgi:hypothetical protein